MSNQNITNKLKSELAQIAITAHKIKSLHNGKESEQFGDLISEYLLDVTYKIAGDLDKVLFPGDAKPLGVEEFINIRLEIEDQAVNGG